MPTNRERFFKLHNIPKEEGLSLEEISELSDIPEEALELVYRRGVGAWRTNPRSVRIQGTFKKDPRPPRTARLGPQQWGAARVYAFVMRTKKVYYGADNDIRVRFGLL